MPNVRNCVKGLRERAVKARKAKSQGLEDAEEVNQDVYVIPCDTKIGPDTDTLDADAAEQDVDDGDNRYDALVFIPPQVQEGKRDEPDAVDVEATECQAYNFSAARDQLVFVSDSPNSSAAELDTASDSDDMSQGSDGAADPGQDALAAALSSLTAAGLQIIDPEDIIYQGREEGQGAYGNVQLAKYHGSFVAVKKLLYRPDPRSTEPPAAVRLRRLLNEAAPLLRLRHPRIVQLIGVVMDSETSALVMEYVPLTLDKWCEKQRIKLRLNPDTTKMPARLPLETQILQLDILRQLADVLDHVTTQHCCHGDLKPVNIGMRTFTIPAKGDFPPTVAAELKLLDFGLSRRMHMKGFVGFLDSNTESMRGTFEWCSPEVMTGTLKTTDKVDTYSFGVVGWQTATLGAAVLLKPRRTAQDILGLVAKGFKPPAPAAAACHPALHQLMCECCSLHSDDRPCMKDVRRRLHLIQVDLIKQLEGFRAARAQALQPPPATAPQPPTHPPEGFVEGPAHRSHGRSSATSSDAWDVCSDKDHLHSHQQQQQRGQQQQQKPGAVSGAFQVRKSEIAPVGWVGCNMQNSTGIHQQRLPAMTGMAVDNSVKQSPPMQQASCVGVSVAEGLGGAVQGCASGQLGSTGAKAGAPGNVPAGLAPAVQGGSGSMTRSRATQPGQQLVLPDNPSKDDCIKPQLGKQQHMQEQELSSSEAGKLADSEVAGTATVSQPTLQGSKGAKTVLDRRQLPPRTRNSVYHRPR